MVSGLLNIYGSRDKNDDVIYQHLLSRGIAGVSFCFIPCVEEISGGRGVYTSNKLLQVGVFVYLYVRNVQVTFPTYSFKLFLSFL